MIPSSDVQPAALYLCLARIVLTICLAVHSLLTRLLHKNNNAPPSCPSRRYSDARNRSDRVWRLAASRKRGVLFSPAIYFFVDSSGTERTPLVVYKYPAARSKRKNNERQSVFSSFAKFFFFALVPELANTDTTVVMHDGYHLSRPGSARARLCKCTNTAPSPLLLWLDPKYHTRALHV